MAKRGRKPIDKTIDDLPDSVRSQIDERIASAANESAAEIFRALGLASRGLRLDTFTRYAGLLRRQRQGEALASKLLSQPDHLSDPELIARLKRMVLIDAVARLEAGDSKLYETMSLLSRIQEFDRLEIERAAEARAGEKHEAWRAEASKRIRAAVEARTPSGETLTREAVCDMIDQVMRGGA